MLHGAGRDESTELGRGLRQELMFQEDEAVQNHSNTDSETFLGQTKVRNMLCHLFYPLHISKKFSATRNLFYFSLLKTALCKLSLIKTSFSICPQSIP